MTFHKIKEILLIGLGDMNVVTLAEILAEAIAYRNKCSQVFQPEITTPEVILKVAIRISEKPLSICPQICSPNYTIVLDDSLLKILNVTEGLKKSGILLVNSSHTPHELIEFFGIEFTTATVDVDVVSMKELDEESSNNHYTGILGAFCRISGEVSLEELNQAVVAFYSGSITQKLIKSMRKAFRTVKIV
ncbi:MAG: 2-oxoacid:acceptor oxidoreductase family protein [Promethearchaeota archaeon]